MDWVIFLPLLLLLQGEYISAASHDSEGFYMECGTGSYVDKHRVEFGHLSPGEGCIPEVERCHGRRRADSRPADDCYGDGPCFVPMSSYYFPRCPRVGCVMVTYWCLGEYLQGKILTVNYTYPDLTEITTQTAATATTVALPEMAKTSTLIGLSVGISLLALLVIGMIVTSTVICIKRRKLQDNSKSSLTNVPSSDEITTSKTDSNALQLSVSQNPAVMPTAPPVSQHSAVTPTAPPAPSSVYVDIGDSHIGEGLADTHPYIAIDNNIGDIGTGPAETSNSGTEDSSLDNGMGVAMYTKVHHNRDQMDRNTTELHENTAYISVENKD